MSGGDLREVQAYYARDEEADRLARGVGRVEFARTVEVIARTLPPAPATVADIGGGPGRYTDWLLERGYSVVHRDLISSHVERVASRHPDIDTAVGDATALDVGDRAVDAVLLLGPIYHLREEADRIQALRESQRIVRPGGVVYVAAISRWATRLHGMLVQRIHETHPRVADVIDDKERTGWLPPVHDGSFTCYAHRPSDLGREIDRSGLSLQSLVGVEGITFAIQDLDERMDDPVQRALVLDSLRAVESVPELLGAGLHLLATARRS